MGVHNSHWECELWTTCVPVHTYIIEFGLVVNSCWSPWKWLCALTLNCYMYAHIHIILILHYGQVTNEVMEGAKLAYHSDIHFVHLIFAKCHIGDCMCRRELSVIGLLLFSVFATEVIYKVVHHTCVPYPHQTTDQYSLWWVSQETSPSASPPSPTPSKRAATSTWGALRTSQWSTLFPLRRQSTSPSVGAVWSIPSTTWWSVWATSPLPPHSLATRGESPLLWKTQSCKVSYCSWSEGGWASRLDWEVSIYLI